MGDGEVSVGLDRATGLIRVSFTGSLSESSLFQASSNSRSLPEFASGWKLIIDMTAITGVVVTTDVMGRFAEAARERADRNPIAFVTKHIATFGLARIYEIIADPKAERISVFYEEQRALQWLASLG